MHEDGVDRRDEGHDRGRQTQPGDPAACRKRFLHPGNTLFEGLANATAFIRAASSSINAVLSRLPAARRLSSAVRGFSPAQTKWLDSDQAPLQTR